MILAVKEFIPKMASSLLAQYTLEWLYTYKQATWLSSGVPKVVQGLTGCQPTFSTATPIKEVLL